MRRLLIEFILDGSLRIFLGQYSQPFQYSSSFGIIRIGQRAACHVDDVGVSQGIQFDGD